MTLIFIKQWIFRFCNINDQNSAEYGEGNKIKSSSTFEIKVIKSSYCDSSDEYILVAGDIRATGGDASTNVAFKSCALFLTCITHIAD